MLKSHNMKNDDNKGEGGGDDHDGKMAEIHVSRWEGRNNS